MERDVIAEAQALIEPLTGYSDGPWWAAPYSSVVGAPILAALDEKTPCVSIGSMRFCKADADLAAAAPAMRDSIAALLAHIEAQQAEWAEQFALRGKAEAERDRALAREAEKDRRIAALEGALRTAEAALADIGDAEREPDDDLAWCEARAAAALPAVRAALEPRP